MPNTSYSPVIYCYPNMCYVHIPLYYNATLNCPKLLLSVRLKANYRVSPDTQPTFAVFQTNLITWLFHKS